MKTAALLLTAFAASLLAQAPSTYVRVSPRDSRYLELSDGKPYIPIGLNMIAPPGERGSAEDGFRVFEQWVSSLSANRGNYIRVWLSNPFWDVEHEKSGVYDEEKAVRIDRMLDLARKHGIRVKMTMEHFRSVGGGRQRWADKPLHHVSNGGPAESIEDFFNGERSREQFKRKIQWYGKRYGDQPVIYGWELWNEINAVRGGDYLAWTEVMLPELHKTFPRNLAMQSLGSFDNARWREPYRRHSTMPGNDIAQVHRYLDLGAELEVCKGPVDVLAADSIRELIGYDPKRPVILAESGAVEPRHTGPFKYYKKDTAGILLHDVLFAPFFAGSAGPGQIWHWDSYVSPNNLWHHYARFAEAVRDLDPPAEKFEPVMLEHDRLRVYALNGRRTVLLWLRDKQNTWITELENGAPPERLVNAALDLSSTLAGKKPKRVQTYDPWTNRWTKVPVNGGQVSLPAFSRSLVLRIDR